MSLNWRGISDCIVWISSLDLITDLTNTHYPTVACAHVLLDDPEITWLDAIRNKYVMNRCALSPTPDRDLIC